ncbi:hypothetical protein [Streptomyces sp. NPDC049881]|uniref:hypothetical protein n=1 Tax=Streptomyces sp. NPDC049881 TaxID=3155778 RepID=UPI00341D63FD
MPTGRLAGPAIAALGTFRSVVGPAPPPLQGALGIIPAEGALIADAFPVTGVVARDQWNAATATTGARRRPAGGPR